jgi:hypothetical protein
MEQYQSIDPEFVEKFLESIQVLFLLYKKSKLQLAGGFGVFVDQKGITRCGGILENANIHESVKHPILLDPRHQLTRLIVRYCHERKALWNEGNLD